MVISVPDKTVKLSPILMLAGLLVFDVSRLALPISIETLSSPKEGIMVYK